MKNRYIGLYAGTQFQLQSWTYNLICRAAAIPSNLPEELVLTAVRNSLRLKKNYCLKKETIKCYYSNLLTLKKILDVNNTEFVAVLVRFLGASALPFCDLCSTQVKPRGSEDKVPWYLVSGEKFAVLSFTVTHACWTWATVRMLYWPSENKMAAHPFLRVGWALLRIHSVFLTISESTFKVFIVKKQIRMCNYSIFYGNYFDIHFQYRQKVYISEKVDMAIFFQWQYRQIEISWKNDIPTMRTELTPLTS